MNLHDMRETRDPEARERELMARLPAQIAHARAAAPAFGRLFADVDADSVCTREHLATLPVTRKSELLELQKAARPFGGFSAVGWGAGCSPRPARSMSPKAHDRTIIASRVRCAQRASVPAIWCTTPSPITSPRPAR